LNSLISWSDEFIAIKKMVEAGGILIFMMMGVIELMNVPYFGEIFLVDIKISL
jgi:hypothetical protein